MWNCDTSRSERYSPASLLSDWSDGHNNNNHYSMKSAVVEDNLPDTDTEELTVNGYSYEPPGSRAHYREDGGIRSYSNDFGYATPELDAQPSVRSGSQQSNNHVFKCRQLPCKTFISTGSCPYGDRCVFLHDPSIVSKPVYIKTKRKSKEDNSPDIFFWPTMSLNSVMGKVDGKNMPSIAQHYIVPTPCSYSQFNTNNDHAVFSMWEHFLDFLKSDSLSIVTVPRNVPPLNPYQIHNPYNGKKRLPVFMKLSQTNNA